jgi:hypothetical protein
MLRTIERRLRPYFRAVFPRAASRRKSFDFFADGMGTKGKILAPLLDAAFVDAYQFAHDGNVDAWRGKVPNIRWRGLTCCWAARHALALEGDFVECGVNTGILSMTVCHYLGFENLDRRFFLYDTFDGIPVGALSGAEKAMAESINDRLYFDCFEIAAANFARYPNVKLVRGLLPGTLAEECPDRIAYLSIDMNSETFERQTIDALWSRLVPGAAVIIDDYGFAGHEAQHRMWNAFAAEKGTAILPVPTGQGVLLKC